MLKPELEIFLDTVNYKRIENSDKEVKQEFALLCQDNVKASLNNEGVRIIVTCLLVFDPEEIFTMSVSFGTDLKFNERKLEHDWENNFFIRTATTNYSTNVGEEKLIKKIRSDRGLCRDA